MPWIEKSSSSRMPRAYSTCDIRFSASNVGFEFRLAHRSSGNDAPVPVDTIVQLFYSLDSGSIAVMLSHIGWDLDSFL